MKAITLSDVIKKELKDEKFATEYTRELLINAIAKLVVRLRKNKKLTQKQLAEMAGTSQSVIARLEGGNDTRIPSLDILNRIANATHTKINLTFEDDY